MFLREITALVIAALLMTGGAVSAAQVTEYGIKSATEQKTPQKKTSREGNEENLWKQN